jgi:hypothetical protein
MTDDEKTKITKLVSQMQQAMSGCQTISYTVASTFKGDDTVGMTIALDALGQLFAHAFKLYGRVREEVLKK